MPHSLHHHDYVEYSLKREITEIYLSMVLRNVGISLLSVFEVIYLYQYFDASITKALAFFAVVLFAYGVLAPFGGKMLTRIGVKHSILLSSPFLFLYYLALFFLPTSAWFVLGAACVGVIHKLLFWPAFHVDFSRFGSDSKRGRQTSLLMVISLCTGVIGPLFGGLIIQYLGYAPLFIVTMILVLTSALPLFFSKEVHEVYSLSWTQAMRRVFAKKLWRQSIAFAAQGGEHKILAFVWPLFLFLTLTSFTTVGVVTSAVFLTVLLFTVFLGRLADRVSRERFLRIGASLNAIAWVFRGVIQTNIQAFVSDAVARVSQRAAYVPFFTLFYDQAKRLGSDIDEFIVYREMVHNMTAGIVLGGVTLLVALTNSLTPAFIVAAVLSLAFLFLLTGQRPSNARPSV